METGRELAEANRRTEHIHSDEALRSTESLVTSTPESPVENQDPASAQSDAIASTDLSEEKMARESVQPAAETAPTSMTTENIPDSSVLSTLSESTSEEVATADSATNFSLPHSSGEADELSETEDDHHEEHHSEEYHQASKEELLHIIQDLQKEEDLKKVDTTLRQLKPRFDQLKEQEKSEALLKFVAEGGVEDDFEYRNDPQSQQFENLYRQLREKRAKQLKELERSKEKNLATKTALLERLRLLVDSEETQASIEAVKEIQKEWKATGSVAAQHGNTLWASYHALLERHYTNRTIYYELKELDRRKNLEAKIELCEKAEKFALKEPSSAVIKELNELHEEYRHLGPVPKEEQETIWQRFKAASDAVYVHRRQQLEHTKREMEDNYQRKTELVQALSPYLAFDSQKISDWNDKTQEILEIQKQWNAIGAVPKEKAKEISKLFWHTFKTFFHHKNDFFKKLEEYRAKNLHLKTQLCERVEALLQSEEIDKTADEVKKLQLEWKNVGPVPEKFKNQIFDRFKTACDSFFNRRRENRSETDRQYEDNLVKKSAICKAIEELASHRESDVSKLEQLKSEWATVGFVPRKNMHSIQKQYLDAIHLFAQNADQLSGIEKEKVKLTAEVDASKHNPSAFKNLQNKEVSLRKKLTQLENDIALWKNNIEFFSHSKNADKLREEFGQKIMSAEKELKETKAQIKLLEQF